MYCYSGMDHLTNEEAKILRDFKRGEFVSIRGFEAEKARLESAAREHFRKDKRINIRISSRGLMRSQKKATSKGRVLSDADQAYCANS